MKTIAMVSLFAALALLTGCTRPLSAQVLLESAGYSDVQMHGFGWLDCSDDDFFRDRFTATGPTGKPVSGTVCTGLFFKGGTIRLD